MKVSSLHRLIVAAKHGGGHKRLSVVPDVRSAGPFWLWSGCCHYTKHFQPSANVFNQSLRFDFLFSCLCWGVWRQFKAIKTLRLQQERETLNDRWPGHKNRATKGLNPVNACLITTTAEEDALSWPSYLLNASVVCQDALIFINLSDYVKLINISCY